MKKSTRKFISVILALCLVMAFALSVSAANYVYNGTYKNQGFQTTTTYTKTYLKGTIGSASTYNLRVTLLYSFYDSKEKGYVVDSFTSSVTKPSSTSLSVGLNSPSYFTSATFTYRVDGSVMQTFSPTSFPST